jgi:dihydrofolate synthase/folylpolyglutamate synthase
VVTAADQPEVLEVIRAACDQARAPLVQVGQDVVWTGVTNGISGQTFNVSGTNFYYRDLFIPLLGRHQLVNAATAVQRFSS